MRRDCTRHLNNIKIIKQIPCRSDISNENVLFEGHAGQTGSGRGVASIKPSSSRTLHLLLPISKILASKGPSIEQCGSHPPSAVRSAERRRLITGSGDGVQTTSQDKNNCPPPGIAEWEWPLWCGLPLRSVKHHMLFCQTGVASHCFLTSRGCGQRLRNKVRCAALGLRSPAHLRCRI